MFKSILLLVLAMASIQFGASQAKQLFPILGVAGTSTLRLLFASIMMSLVFRPWKARLNKSILLYGASLGLMNFSFYFALKRIPLGIAVALEFTGPLAVAVFSSKKKIDYLWAILAAGGIALLLPKIDTHAPLDPVGIVLALLAGLFWALYIIFGKKAGEHHNGGVIASLGMITAAALVFPFGLIIDGVSMFQWSAWPLALGVALFGSALPYSLEMIAMKKMPAQTFGVLMSLEPALAALMGYIFLSESLTLTQWLAIGCVMGSSLGSSLSNQNQ